MLDVGAAFDLDPDRVWLNAAHQGPLPRRASEAAGEAIRWKERPRVLAGSDLFTKVPAGLRASIATLLDVPPDEITLANSASYGLHVVANGLGLGDGDEVVVAANDFPSDVLPWLRLRERGVHVARIIPSSSGVASPDEVDAAITPRTRVVCLPWVHSFSGHVSDVAGIGEVCRAHRVWFVLNGSQGIGAIPIAPASVPVDAFIGVGFKWLCGPYGTGFLWMSDQMSRHVAPQKLYWLNAMTSADLAAPELDMDGIRPSPTGRHDIFGTANFFNFTAWTAAIELITEVGVSAIHQHDLALAALIERGLDDGPFEVLPRGDRDRLSSILFVRTRHGPIDELATRLDTAGIDVSVRRGMIRLSPHLYNTVADVTRLLDAMR